jgi:hypothetical protein
MPSPPPSTPSPDVAEDSDDDLSDLRSSIFGDMQDNEEKSTSPIIESQDNSKVSFLWTQIPLAPRVYYNDPDLLLSFPTALIPDTILDTLRDLLSDNIYLRNRLEWSESRRNELEEKDRCRFSLPTLEAKDDEIIGLKKRYRNIKFLQRFETMKAQKWGSKDLKDFKSQFERVQNAIRALSSKDLLISLDGRSASSNSEDLTELKSRAFAEGQPLLAIADAAIHSGLHLQALVAAAVCEWVFNSHLQCAAMMNTPILAKYRHHLRTTCESHTLLWSFLVPWH